MKIRHFYKIREKSGFQTTGKKAIPDFVLGIAADQFSVDNKGFYDNLILMTPFSKLP